MWFKLMCLMVMLCFVHFSYVDGLNTNDTGVCVVTRSVTKPQRRLYKVKYKCGKKVCTGKRTLVKNVTVTQNDISCCGGWEYNSDQDVCSPVCSIGCVGGRCIAPDDCQCDPPAIRDQHNKNVCHLPICDPPCQNGECTATNQCKCFDGYENTNNTCQPKCISCDNGHCKAPNICECFEGYAKSDGVCRPSCEGCDNGVCRSPNVCECNEGYVRNDTSKLCYKPCPEDCAICDNGHCRDGVCGGDETKIICCDGYNWARVKGVEVCKPTCRPSCGRHGVCINPNECRCEPPYVFRQKTCLLPVTCDDACVNAECTDHNTCTCNFGYTRRNESVCDPNCTPSCVNSVCTAPDKCECLEGYKSINQFECLPECDECENGECIAPNDCKCNSGYAKKDNKCIPVCDRDCQYGRCSKPNECTCDIGYEHDPLDKFTCRPICETKCVNAICVAPNQCSCISGFTRTENWAICKPECDYCTNGDCIGPNICRCHSGYTMIGIKCKPVCAQDCVNGFCSEPDKCSCLGGYKHDDKNKYLCNPDCSQKCINATCVSPEVCECFEGFEKDNSNHTCKPKCSGCENGQCISPEVCSCNEGYIMSNGTCKPVCSETCINGYCKSPNVCGCLDGYKLNLTQPAACYKTCRSPCVNGVCSMDGSCICNPGFELYNETCVTNETVSCKSCEGSCVDDVCRCRDGRLCDSYYEAANTGLAGLEMTWILGGCVGLLLFILVIAIIGQMWRKRSVYDKTDYAGNNANGSVVFTAPNTLQNRMFSDNKVDEDLYNGIEQEEEEEEYEIENVRAADRLLSNEVLIEDAKL